LDFLQSFISFLLKTGVYAGIFCCLILVFLYLIQDKLLYIPEAPNQAFKYPENNPKSYRNPGERNIPYDDIYIKTKDGFTLHGWFLKQKNSTQVDTIIYFHENAGNIGNRMNDLENFYYELGMNVILVGYRGYGHSEGKPGEVGIGLDAEAIFEFASNSQLINPKRIVLFGRSLGGAVAIQIASKANERVKALILENTFTSIPDMVDHLFPYLKFFKHIVLRISWNSLQKIGNLEQPIFFINGDKDELVPPKLMETLFNAAKKSKLKDRLIVSGGMHNTTSMIGGKDYIFAIRDFFEKVDDYAMKAMPGIPRIPVEQTYQTSTFADISSF